MLVKMQSYFVVCLSVYFVYCKASFDCNESSKSACKDYTVGDFFPETENQLEITCRNILDRLQCSVDFEDECKKEKLPSNTNRRLLEYMKEVCTPSHPIYLVTVDNLKCVKPVMDGTVGECFNDFPSEESFRNYSKALLDKGIDAFPGDETNHVECLMALYSTACRKKEMEKCGKTAVDAFLIFAQDVNSILVDECGDKVGKYLRDIISVINGENS